MLLYPTYFSPIAQYVAIAKAAEIVFEVEDNFQKQTYRNRCYIYGASGKQLLNVPVLKANSKQKTKDVQIDYSENWSKQHIRAMDAAYRSSPFYEFYEDAIKKMLSVKEKYLLDLNFNCYELLEDLLELEVPYQKTISYSNDYSEDEDFRFLVNAKKDHKYNFDHYIQVFSHEHGFLENLSILDLLFMEGPAAFVYLQNQTITQ